MCWFKIAHQWKIVASIHDCILSGDVFFEEHLYRGARVCWGEGGYGQIRIQHYLLSFLYIYHICNVGKQWHKSPIWEWFIPPMYGDLGDGLWHFFTYNYSNMKPFLALPISTGWAMISSRSPTICEHSLLAMNWLSDMMQPPKHNSSQIGLVSDSGFNPSEKNSQLGWFFPICEKIIQPCSKPSTSGAILRVKLEGGWTPWLNVQLCHVWSHTTLKSHVGNAATLMNIFLPRFNASTC